MDQKMRDALEQAREILDEIQKATAEAQRESTRLLQHFGKKLETLEVERMKQRISHLNQQV